MANPDPRLVAAIRQLGGNLAPLLLATTLVESGGRLNAVGDGGMSIGPYQMHSRGRGYKVPAAKRMDPVFSTKSALAEFLRFRAKGLSGPELAYAAQRPADKAGYIRKIAAALPEANRILGSAPKSGGNPVSATDPGGGPSSPSPGSLPQLSSIDSRALMALLNKARLGALQGNMPGPEYASGLNKIAQTLRASVQQAAQQQQSAPAPGGGDPVRQAASVPVGPSGGVMVQGAIPGSPIPGQKPRSSSHPTSGLAGYPAFDYMAPAGTPTVAPESGTVFKLSGKSPKAGGPSGGPLGYSIYIQGKSGKKYFITHLDKVRVKVGQRVRQGQQIAVVADGPSSWSSPHAHMGVSG